MNDVLEKFVYALTVEDNTVDRLNGSTEGVK